MSRPGASLLHRATTTTAATTAAVYSIPCCFLSSSLPSLPSPNSLENHLDDQIIFHFQIRRRNHLYNRLKSCSSQTHFLQIHTQFTRGNLLQFPSLSLTFLQKASSFFIHNNAYIRRIFDQISSPNTFHYNFMIRVFVESEFYDRGLVFYREMRRDCIVADHMTMSFCMKCSVKSLGLVEGMQVHGRILLDGYERDCVLMTSLMEMYSVCGRREDACKVFDEMPQRDTAVYNALISCFLINKRTRDSLAVFESMLSLGRECRPDDVTCLLLLRACAVMGALDFGRGVREYAEKRGYGGHLSVNNALIMMYSKCGLVKEAYKIFEGMPIKNLVTWTTMIAGFGMNGYGKDAAEMFLEMHRMGVAPDDKALTAVMHACSRTGLLNEGMELYENMTKEFGIQPSIHHYGCVVDILCRLGLLEEAYELLLSMEVKPDAKVWRTLLVACRTYKKSKLADRVIDHIVEIKALEAGDYLLLLNTYSSNAKWDKVKALRNFMKENKIMTAPGCSTIELKGVVHEFRSDASHQCKEEIYAMLNEILQQLKIAGYVPQMSSEFHDLKGVEIETAVSYHSEKLAMAFAALTTSPGTTIRVANSVRICVDCHEFAKAFSATYNRKVIIRDRNRIHHFREGECSCRDCW